MKMKPINSESEYKFDGKVSWFQSLIIRTLKEGPIPNHLAFIMDGNRRFARHKGLPTEMGTKFGAKSFNKLCWFLNNLGVRELTIYAFSLENFNRDKLEIKTFMGVFKDFLEDLLISNFGYKVRFIGNCDTFPEDIQEVMIKCAEATKDYTNQVVNVCVGYTSRDDITNSMKIILKQVEDGELDPSDIDADLVTKNLYTKDCSVPDMLIRTSGETRLSDFLLWETSETIILFLDECWPDIGFMSMLKIILFYQLRTLNRKK